MDPWRKTPFLRLSLLFITGILVSGFIRMSDDKILWVGVILCFIIVMALFFHFRMGYGLRWIHGIFFIILLSLLGFFRTQLWENNARRSFKHIKETSETSYLVQLSQIPVEKPRSVKSVGRLLAVKDSAGWEKAQGKILMYFQKDSLMDPLSLGDRILFEATVSENKKPANPDVFDYSNYLKRHGIYHQVYISNEQWNRVKAVDNRSLQGIAHHARMQLVQVLKSNRLQEDEVAIASAILLGYDELLNQDLRNSFAAAGAMHILCVSGLHVGVIYLILSFLMKAMSRKRWQRILKVLIIVGMIWVYALITGFSPSVLRAGMMFSFLSLGKLFNRDINNLNLVFASAFVLLVINPFFLYEIGFQLSYAAVIGIILLYPIFKKIVYSRYWLIQQFWSLTVISIIAQLFTAPFAIYYFHQFPNLFLLTNYLVIPLTTLILYTGILLFLFSWVPFMAALIGTALNNLISFLLNGVQWIEHIDGSTSRDLYLTSLQLFLIFTIIILITGWVTHKKKVFVWPVLGLVIALLSNTIVVRLNQYTQRNICFYCIPNTTAVGTMEGKKCYLFQDSLIIKNQAGFDFNIKNHLLGSGIDHVNFVSFDTTLKHGTLRYSKHFLFAGNELFYFAGGPVNAKSSKKIIVNTLLMSGQTSISIEKLATLFTIRQLVIDLSVPKWKRRKWIEQCKKLDINYWDMAEQGALNICLEN